MKQKNNEGFSLIEILVGMAILALIVLPTCTGMVMSFRINAKTNQMLQAQLAVSSAVETLMAEGYNSTNVDKVKKEYSVEITMLDGTSNPDYCKINVISAEKDGTPNNLVSVITYVHRVPEIGGGT